MPWRDSLTLENLPLVGWHLNISCHLLTLTASETPWPRQLIDGKVIWVSSSKGLGICYDWESSSKQKALQETVKLWAHIFKYKHSIQGLNCNYHEVLARKSSTTDKLPRSKWQCLTPQTVSPTTEQVLKYLSLLEHTHPNNKISDNLTLSFICICTYINKSEHI